MDLTRRERDEILARKMPIIEKLNEEIGRRQREITQDEMWAQKSAAIFVEAPPKPRVVDHKNRLLPASRDQDGDQRWPRGGMCEGERGRKPLGEVNHFHRAKPNRPYDNTNKYYSVDQFAKREFSKDPQKQGPPNKPPSPPRFNFLADPYRDTPSKQHEPEPDYNVRSGGCRRYPGNFGGKNLFKTIATPHQNAKDFAKNHSPHTNNDDSIPWNNTNNHRNGEENGSENSYKSDSEHCSSRSNSSHTHTKGVHTTHKNNVGGVADGQAYIKKHLSHYNRQNRRQDLSANVPLPQRNRNFSPDLNEECTAFRPVLRSKTETNILLNNHRRKPHMLDKIKNAYNVAADYSNRLQSPDQITLDRSNQNTKSFTKSQCKTGSHKSTPKNTLNTTSRDSLDNSKNEIKDDQQHLGENHLVYVAESETGSQCNKTTNQTPSQNIVSPHKNEEDFVSFKANNYDLKSSPAYRILDSDPLINLSDTAITREEYEAVLEEIMGEDPFLASQDVNFEPPESDINFENLRSLNFSAPFISPILQELSNLSLMHDPRSNGVKNVNPNPESDPPLAWDSSVDIGNS